MFNIERWQEIFEAISKNKLRTFLTGLSVSSGIFILIILLGIAEGLRKGTKKQFENDIPTKIQFFAGRTGKSYKGLNPNRKIDFSPKDYAAITNKYKDEIQFESPVLVRYGAITNYKENNGSYIIFAVKPDSQFLNNAYLISGRFINQRDYDNKAKVVVLGQRPIKDLFGGNYKEAVGKIVVINNTNYKVIGVFEDEGGERQDTYMYIPHSTFSTLYNMPNNIGRMEFTLNPSDSYDEGLNRLEDFGWQVKNYLHKAHNVHPDDNKGIVFRNMYTQGKNIYMVNLGMKFFFWGIGILTLLSGIVGVSNIMLIIVKERTKEIGIRKALGAQPKSIVGMILQEAIFITTISGFLGLFFALGLLEFAGPYIQTDVILNPNVPFSVAVFTVILLIIAGAIAGYIPARHAAKIRPIVALRDE